MKPYPKYKDSGIEWIGEVPEHWRVEKLKWIAKVRLSNIDKKSKEGELAVELCNYVDVYYNDNITSDIEFMKATARQDQIDIFSLQEGDILITKDSETPDDIAVPAFVSSSLHDVVCGYHLAHIRPYRKYADGNYLFRSFSAHGISDQFEISANGVTRFGIGKQAIDNSVFLTPTLEEQTAISAYLDRKTAQIDNLISKKQKLIELLKEERAAIINQAVTKGLNPDAPMKDSGIKWLGEIPAHWEVKRLKHIAKIILGKMLTNVDKGDYHYRPYLRAQNISWEKVNVKDVKNMWFSKGELQQYRLRKNDLLVSEGGEVGRTSMWEEEIEECYIQNSVHKVTMEPTNDPFFFLYSFCLLGQKGVFESVASRISIAHLTKEKLKEVFFSVPPMYEQRRISKFIGSETTKIDQTISKIAKQINLLQEFRTALISEVVTGKIDVRDEGLE
jgi:type I restriction enzyme S subunit